MRKVLPLLTLMTGLLLASAPANLGTAVAQGTKKDKDKDTKTITKGGAGLIEIAKGKDDKFRFFVRDGEGKLLAMSSPSGFASEKEAKDAIEVMRKVVATAKVVEKKAGKEK